MADEILPGASPVRRVVRVGDTVRRQTAPWTPAVHTLLCHLKAAGFPYAPRALGLDEQGREVLTYIEGASGADGWKAVERREGLGLRHCRSGGSTEALKRGP